MRRNYRFCDETETIYMDVRLPMEEEWLKVTAEMAKEANSKRQANSESDTKRRIALSSPPSGSLRNPRTGASGANAVVLGRLPNSSTTTSTHHTGDQFPVNNS